VGLPKGGRRRGRKEEGQQWEIAEGRYHGGLLEELHVIEREIGEACM
jgi:hypothetical protein